MSVTPEERRARMAEKRRQYYEANKEAVTEQKRQYREANKEAVTERHRRYYEANKEAKVERNRQYREANKEAVAEKRRQYYEANKEAVTEKRRQYYEANKEAVTEKRRQRTRRNGFAKEDGSSFRAWLASLAQSHKTFEAIANFQPDPGQTLAELIHKLSGYAMDVCEQIANPPILEGSPALTPPAAPDLF